MQKALVVGFDLDMTLVDSRPGIAACFRALAAQTGVFIDAAAAIARLGPPLRDEIRLWFPPDRVEAAVAAYRALYPSLAVSPSLPLPGAAAAVRAVRDRGGRVVVVTAKLGRLAQLHLDHLGIEVDGVAGDRFGHGKAAAIAEQSVQLYVGDHVADMAAAVDAGVPGIGVATGPCSAAELAAAGARVVLEDLTAFPAALATWAPGDPMGIGVGSSASDG